ncbi:hypothetical protein C8J57DRAFT_1605879 [Mycena rebaudengoi]|nr:hypothetical protein C8J57DRAFT_1605879 [Mycena rebaudengoi]
MSHNYAIRPIYSELPASDGFEESDAVSTVEATSSPPAPPIPDFYIRNDMPFLDLGPADLPQDEGSDIDGDYDPSNVRAKKSTDTEKALAVLGFMKERFPRFSLRSFLDVLFTSDDGAIKNVTNTYLQTGGAIHLLDVAIGDKGMRDDDVGDWIMDKAALICEREVSWLTDRASRGPYFDDAQSLHLPSRCITVNLVQSFSLPGLLLRYERATSRLQKFLKIVISKDSPPVGLDAAGVRSQRNPDMGRTLITSMILNLRSRKTNLHGAMNALMLWDGRVPKRLVQALNRYGFCPSNPFLARAVESLTKDSVRLAKSVANDPEKLKLLPYDNFNWMARAYETSVTHGSTSHDQVSALLVVIRLPEGSPPSAAAELGSIHNFESTARTRHRLPSHQSLAEILPSQQDQLMFAANAATHIGHILTEEVQAFSAHRKDIPQFFDPHALPPDKSEEYFLPTYDQEQSSTRGNMLVIEHYFRDIFGIPKETFETQNFFLLGDRLTTARDRAAQDQRAVDRSEFRVDHLSSFEMLSGIMHFTMNQVHDCGKNMWGGANRDRMSLVTLLEKLPNRGDINLRKIDYYAWLRFLDVVLRALVLKAAMVVLNLKTPADLSQQTLTPQGFSVLCDRIAAEFLLPSVDRLEADGVKTLSGATESGNAVLMMHDIMTIREMRHAVKHGHPERMERMLKYWMPMFYAGGSFNYANEGMELLHNLNHDWPPDISPLLRGAMIMNNQGKPHTNKETDIRVEQFNKTVKSHAHGANARPGLLEKITPAIGHVQELTEQIFEDLGVNDEDQYHTKVRQHKDVAIILNLLCDANIFEFAKDTASPHSMIDLYRFGSHRVAGHDGGHERHLRRHHLRAHNERPQFTLQEALDNEMERWGIDYNNNDVDLYE